MRLDLNRHETLDDAKAHAKASIDAAAERARLRYITPGSGQSMEYDQAYQDAVAMIEGLITESEYLQADVNAGTINPDTMAPVTTQLEAAYVVKAMRDMWHKVGARLRDIRLRTKRQIDAATNVSGVIGTMRAAISELERL